MPKPEALRKPKGETARKYCEGLLAENAIDCALSEALSKDLANFNYRLGGDWYDSSLEVYFETDLPFPWEPSLETKKAMYELGFAIVYWNFPDGTEIRGEEPRRSKAGPHRYVEGVGYVCEKFQGDWIGGPYDCRDKL